MTLHDNPQQMIQREQLIADFLKLEPAQQTDMLAWARWMISKPRARRAEFYRRFGARIQAFRVYMGYRNPDDFARMIGWKPSVYRPYEEGQRSQSAAINRLIFAIVPFGISLDWLFMDGSHSPMVRGFVPESVQRRKALYVVDGGLS